MKLKLSLKLEAGTEPEAGAEAEAGVEGSAYTYLRDQIDLHMEARPTPTFGTKSTCTWSLRQLRPRCVLVKYR